MLKRTLIVLAMAVAMFIAIQPLQTVHAILMTVEEVVALDSVSHVAGNGAPQNNSFARALGAPFRAIGRLFGKGKKDSNKLERISEKDAKRFETGPRIQVNKTTTAAASSSGTAPDSRGMMTTGKQSAAEALAASAVDHLEKGRALLNSHDLNGAIGELSLAASANPKLSEASTLLGVAYWRKGLRDLAERSFENAVRIKKDDSQNLNNLGFLHYENGDYETATKYLKRAAKLAPGDPRIWNNLGLAQCERGKFDEAVNSFTHAAGEVKSRLNIAERLRYQGLNQEAIKHLEKARIIAPNSPEVLSKLLNLYLVSNKTEQADEARRSLIAAQALATAPVPE
ncbi:MAG TPA: tetratricopeptide repeat protein [Pyrinomonadaceae bacterium]|nr:tetratricopeptide repeat protein [Pyrinomonadaceae bacterium]